MSHKWAANAYEILSLQAMNSTRAAIRRLPWHISHDNVNIPMRVFSQRLNNQSHFISGCAATVWVLPAIAALPSGANARLQTFRAQHATQIFDFSTVLYGNIDADARIEARNAHHILQVLLNSPEFRDYYAKDDTRFTPPTPTHELPIGSTPDARIQPFILGTCNIEEASYDGTLKVMDEWFRQLHLNSSEEQCRTGRERIIPWLGDQLTVERLRGMWKYRHEDHSSFDRLDYMVPVFGWFHLVMAFANSLHKQYLGTSAGIGGLRQAFDILCRKGLVTQSTKGPFWHHLDEAIQHVSEAHFRASWLIIGNVESLEELKAKSPHELIELSKGLLRKFASREALVEMDEEVPLQLQDQVLKQWTMWNIDILPYLELREAIKVGDIRRMEDLLPTLLFRFAGGGNSKYAIEILELLQGLHCEWPAEIKLVPPLLVLAPFFINFTEHIYVNGAGCLTRMGNVMALCHLIWHRKKISQISRWDQPAPISRVTQQRNKYRLTTTQSAQVRRWNTCRRYPQQFQPSDMFSGTWRSNSRLQRAVRIMGYQKKMLMFRH